ncbi:ferredoxin [Arthrobacter sp. KBS0702]|nr:ferredoxin [Arthrobacter sp. KBS0702]
MELALDKCVGGGQCVLAAPQLFDQDEQDGTVILLRQPEAADIGSASQAELVCPARAIQLIEE